ncbi:MAG: ATP-binding protein [Verrucomicrobiota bacterium]|jgi:signal transduction histidine kinase
MRTPFPICLLAIFCWLPRPLPAGESSDLITNAAQLQSAALRTFPANYSIHWEGQVWWADPAEGRLVLADSSGSAEVEAVWLGAVPHAGQRVRLEGGGTVARAGGGFKIGGRDAVVDNDGVHAMIEKSGTVFLPAGRTPIRVDWFNRTERYGLEVACAGPEFPRQSIPDAAFFRAVQNPANGATNFVNGLDYECYQVAGEALPDFGKLPAIKSGVASNFDLSVLPTLDHIGLRFTGWLEVPREGLYTFFTKSDDGSRLFVGGPTLRLTATGNAEFPAPNIIVPGEILPAERDCQWAQAEGAITFASRRGALWELELTSGAGKLLVEMPDDAGWSTASLPNGRIRATGVCQGVLTADGLEIAGRLLVPGPAQIERLEPEPGAAEISQTNPLPLLTTCSEVHRLKRDEAQRGYPVKLRGVVTSVLPERQAFTLQDGTRGLYAVDCAETRSAPPHIGDFLEIEGRTDPLFFAPIVNASRLTSLGAGRLPAPVRPTWDQLLNGSLDAQYVELQGVITAVATNTVILVTREGQIKLDLRLNGLPPETLAGYEDALVRIRGCLFASWDYVTHEVKAGEIRIYGADVAEDQPAPADMFALPAKNVAELQLFDPQADILQRVKVAGQILHVNGTECLLAQGQDRLRFLTKKEPGLEPGDLVEVVGFPQLSGASPVLREAVARKTGHRSLPPASVLAGDDLVRPDCDATRVRVQGVMVSVQATPTEQILEIQSGVRTFLARLGGRNRPSPPPVGSRLELTGTYSGLGGDKAIGQDISSFELLLNSPADVRVLSRPPWWTLERLLVIVGALLCVLAITALWITQLHRRVEQRTVELEAQIRARQRIEQQHAMEQERARVAQDLHDELGSSLTEISMLGARAKSAPEEKRKFYLEQMSEKARGMIAALDEIVWAMNPRHDSLASLVSYFCLYTDRFLGLASVAWRLEHSPDAPDCAMDSRHRHQLFLAFKEALTNVVRHSAATEVRLNIRQQDGEVRLTIADNGCGLPPAGRTEEMDGVMNMRARLEKLGGRFEITSAPGSGTVVEFHFPAHFP